MKAPHTPVLEEQVLDYLNAGPDRVIVDTTFGAGGHTRAFLNKGASVVAIDQDPGAVGYAEQYGADRFQLVTGNFRDIDEHLQGLGVGLVDGLLCDLGVSSMQLDEAHRGFAFRHSGPLDMRMGTQEKSARDVVNELPCQELAAIIFRFGEERYSRRIARAICEAREEEPITTTERLTEIVAGAYPARERRDHPARRTFQALRIYVNDELGALEDLLFKTPALLRPGGRIAIISYHSLEDRLVKRAFRDDARLEVLTKRPVTADEAEVARNPRARSAKLRIAERRTG